MDVGGQEDEEDSSSTSIVKINIYERESPLLSPSPTLISPAGKKISFHCPGELGETSGETSAANRAATKNSIPTRIREQLSGPAGRKCLKCATGKWAFKGQGREITRQLS